MYLLGFDIGSSAVKACLIEASTGQVVASAASPAEEMEIAAPRPDWAEQDPALWWEHVGKAAALIRRQAGARTDAVAAIGLAYQMHGLVAIDRAQRVVRPAIIWCDGRAAAIGEQAFQAIRPATCRARLLNSPGNFTASKLRWVKEHEPELFGRIDHILLPGDYIALKMTGEARTTASGLSEAILWDYQREETASLVLDHYGIPHTLIPRLVPTFAEQGVLTADAAAELGLKPGIPVTYRAGDQPNNALALGVLNPGDIAATAGTSGVVYGVQAVPCTEERSRVNIFLHVNHAPTHPRYGVLLCVNGAGILNRWIRQNLTTLDYAAMNTLAAQAPVGAAGLLFLPYGNGAERTLGDRDIGACLQGLNLKIHTLAHLCRAAQEGVAFALNYGMEIMRAMGIEPTIIRAGYTNMFLSPLFAETFATLTGTRVELFDTDGAQGAARGAGLGAGIYASLEDAGVKRIRAIDPDIHQQDSLRETYARWHALLDTFLEAR